MQIGVITYGPAAAVESVTKIPTSINIFIILTVCTAYTAMVRHVTVCTVLVRQTFKLVRIRHFLHQSHELDNPCLF